MLDTFNDSTVFVMKTRFRVAALISGLTFLTSHHAMAESKLPKDVETFVEKRDQCDHFRGEEPYDDARATDLGEMLKKYCKGTDKDLARLRKKYSKNKAAKEALDGYERSVE